MPTRLPARLLLGALPAVAASFVVLSISGAGRGASVMQAVSVALMLTIAMVMSRTGRAPSPFGLAMATGVGLALCALPLLGDDSRPRRWITLGTVSVYIAPVVIPGVLAVAARAGRWNGAWATASLAALWGLGSILAWQPDLSQVVALAAGTAVILAHREGAWPRRLLMLIPLAIAAWLAAVQPDPLAPVSYVEQVILVSWRHSLAAGVGVSMAAVALVAAVGLTRTGVDASLAPVAAYYAVLFACSMADLTPAPLVGFGAGPLLGFGVLAGTTALMAMADAPLHSR